jgi:hypothetical protein
VPETSETILRFNRNTLETNPVVNASLNKSRRPAPQQSKFKMFTAIAWANARGAREDGYDF